MQNATRHDVNFAARGVLHALRVVGVAVCVLVAICALVVCKTVSDEAQATREAINSKDNKALEQMFDTQAIETWCKGEDLGTIRMVGAWVYSTNEDGTTTVEDEQGNLWNVQGRVKEETFLLLWLVDNHTPEVKDDQIVKVWCEWYDE